MKTTLLFLSLCIAMTACVYNEELANVTDLYIEKQETALPYSMQSILKGGETDRSRSIPDEAFAQVQFCIRNEMPDLQLTVEGIRLCNMHLSGMYYFSTEEQAPYWETDTTRNTIFLETGNIEIAPNKEALFPQEGSIPFIPQTAKAWNPTILPQQSEGCYLLLNCKVFNEITIWGDEKGNSAEAAIPLSVRFLSNQLSVINLTLAPNCPWYDIQGSSPQPLFVPITFDVSVEDWKE
jgi:hypothetical protein